MDVDLLKINENYRQEKLKPGDTVPNWALGSGAPSAFTFLRGDHTWAPTSGLISTNNLLITYIAQDNIPVFSVVTSNGFIADSTNIAHRNKIIGIATATVLSGFSGQVIGFGEIQNILWTWVTGDRIFLNGASLSTAISLTGFSQFIGVATSPDVIDVRIGQSILL